MSLKFETPLASLGSDGLSTRLPCLTLGDWNES